MIDKGKKGKKFKGGNHRRRKKKKGDRKEQREIKGK